MAKKLTILLLLISLSVISALAKPFTVILDPGHGGKDPGAVGKYGKEKSINLNVALKVGSLIKNKYPDVRVVYTRTTDIYVKLQERPNIANNANGDLFISIHTNASESTKAYGAETFTLGLSKSQANFDVAKRENSVLLLEDDKEVYQGFDPTSPDSYIMFEFMQSKYIDQSVELAYYIQQEFIDIKRLDRGVRQAIFWVLHQVKMPSILVELGFVTNPSEEKFLTSDEGEDKLANCIFHGFEKYKHEYDKRTITTPQVEIIDDNTSNIKESDKTSDSKSGRKGKKNKKENKSSSVSLNPNIKYKIQIFSSRTIVADNDNSIRKVSQHKPISHISENGWYKYMCGQCDTYQEARELLKEVRTIYKDALIVAFESGTKISVSEAQKLEKTAPGKEQRASDANKGTQAPSSISFRVQVFSSRNPVAADNYDMRRAKKLGSVSHYIENGWYKYTCTTTSSYEKSKEYLISIRKHFSDAVIVAFDGDKKISVSDALKKSK